MSKQSLSMFAEFRRRFWQPPRAHGDIIEDRSVSFLELFYDLVFVVVIARASHTLAHDVSWRSFGEYVVIFGLIWIAWLNGTLYHELHGRDDGRSRTLVFVQMTILAVLAVFTGDAAQAGGTGFAITYALLLVLSWLWYTVRRQDTEEFMAMTGWYVGGMLVSAAVMAGTAALPDEARMVVWALVALGWVIGGVALSATVGESVSLGMGVTDSMVERFGLFTIIVLGEVVVGVVDGLGEVERTTRTISSVAAFLVVLTLTMASLEESERFAELYRPLSAAMWVGAAASLAIGWWAPAPWLLAASLALALTVIWFFAVDRSLRLGRADGETGPPVLIRRLVSRRSVTWKELGRFV